MTHSDFLRRLSAEEFAPGDAEGTSRKITDNSYKSLDNHHRTQQALHEKITYNQATKTTMMSVDNVIRELK